MSDSAQLVRGNGKFLQRDQAIPANEITRANLQGAILAVSSLIGLVALACLGFLDHHLYLGTSGECALSIFGAAPIASAVGLSVAAIKKLAKAKKQEALIEEWHKSNSIPRARCENLPASFGNARDHSHSSQLT